MTGFRIFLELTGAVVWIGVALIIVLCLLADDADERANRWRK